MRNFTFIPVLFLFTLCTQAQVTGSYRDNFGSRIQLNTDHTFKYTWHFDLMGSWTTGTWVVKNDTVVLTAIPVYDTLGIIHGTSVLDTICLSYNEIPEKITSGQWWASSFSTGGQNRHPCPDKLFFEKEKLLRIQNGRLVKKKMKGYWSDKKYDPWFFKITQPE